MATRLHPGVYVEEVSSGALAIEAAGTSTAIFVGETERGPLEPMKLRSFDDYQRLYGGYLRTVGTGTERLLGAYALEAFFQNGGTAAYVLRAQEGGLKAGTRGIGSGTETAVLEASSPGAWCNGRLLALLGPSSDEAADRFRIFVLLKDLATGRWRLVEEWDRLSCQPADESHAALVLERSIYLRWKGGELKAPPALDITDSSPTESEVIDLASSLLEEVDFAKQFSNGEGGVTPLTDEDYGTKVLPRLDAVTDAALLVVPGKTGGFANEAVAYVESRPLRDLFYVSDLPREAGSDVAIAVKNSLTSLSSMSRSDLTAVYWPWVQVSDPVGAGRDAALAVPPSGHVAGLYARTDARRGVWKAPAGVEATLLGIRTLDYKLLDGHQDDLNPKGVNALRLMPSAGAVVWGARTLRPDSEWRYVSVRRLALFLRKSLHEGTQWAVFEPNAEPLWASLRTAVGAFMEQLFRQGAFAGRTSREAYFVKCDAETTRPEDQTSGLVNLWVGFAALKPAEFIVVKLSQKTDQKA